MSSISGTPTRVEALREARADSLIEGLREDAGSAVILDAGARGEIDGDEARRRLDANLAAEQAGTSRVA